MKFEVNGKVIPTNVRYRTTINGKTVDLTEVSCNGKTVWKYVPPYVPPVGGGTPPSGGGHWQAAGSFGSPTDLSNGTTIRCILSPNGTYTCVRYRWVPDDEPDEQIQVL